MNVDIVAVLEIPYLTDNEEQNHSQVNPIGQTQKRTATDKYKRSVIEAIKCIYRVCLSIDHANMRR